MDIYGKMTAEQQQAVKQTAQIYNLPPDLLAAIGWHETHWGELGAGRQGWYLGYGYYPGSTVAEKYRGLVPQLTGAAKQIAGFFKGREITQDSWLAFSRESWRAGDPDTWAASTWRLYEGLGGGGGGRTAGSADLASGMVYKAPTAAATEDLSGFNPFAVAGGAIVIALAVAVGLGIMIVGSIKS